MKTVKLCTITHDKLLNNPYANDKRTLFSICSEIKDGASETLTNFFYCRETLVGLFVRFFIKEFDDLCVDSEIEYARERDRDIKIKREDHALYQHKDMPQKKTTIAMHIHVGDKNRAYKKSLDGLAKRSIKLLNHYERRNNWFPSEVYKTDHNAGDADAIYLFKSSRWWMTSTHTFSLYMLLIRLGKYESFEVIEKDTPNSEVVSLLGSIAEGSPEYRNVIGDQPKRWNILLDNRKKIYDGETLEDIFNFSGRLSIKADGIRRLCGDRSTYDTVRERFYKLCKEAGLGFAKNEER